MTEIQWDLTKSPESMIDYMEYGGGDPFTSQMGPKIQNFPSDRKLGLLRKALESELCGEERTTLGVYSSYKDKMSKCWTEIVNIRKVYKPMAAHLIREVLGNPFRIYKHKYDFLEDQTIKDIALNIYEDNDLILSENNLRVLSDIIEEKGCSTHCKKIKHKNSIITFVPLDLYILEHLRNKLPHVKGCWVIDLILNYT